MPFILAYNLSVSYVNLGNVASKKGDYRTSLEYQQTALAVRLQLRKSNETSIADIDNLAFIDNHMVKIIPNWPKCLVILEVSISNKRNI